MQASTILFAPYACPSLTFWGLLTLCRLDSDFNSANASVCCRRASSALSKNLNLSGAAIAVVFAPRCRSREWLFTLSGAPAMLLREERPPRGSLAKFVVMIAD